MCNGKHIELEISIQIYMHFCMSYHTEFYPNSKEQ